MKHLKKIQEENREAIILANNPEAKSYEGALEILIVTMYMIQNMESII